MVSLTVAWLLNDLQKMDVALKRVYKSLYITCNAISSFSRLVWQQECRLSTEGCKMKLSPSVFLYKQIGITSSHIIGHGLSECTMASQPLCMRYVLWSYRWFHGTCMLFYKKRAFKWYQTYFYTIFPGYPIIQSCHDELGIKHLLEFLQV